MIPLRLEIITPCIPITRPQLIPPLYPFFSTHLQAIRGDQRIDGRRALEYRPVQFQFASDDSSCIVRLGRTMAMASISATLDTPYPDHPSEGTITFDVLHLASDAGSGTGDALRRRTEEAVELSRLVERGLREARAVDVEALCVQPGRKVWNLSVVIRVLDDNGNVTDAVGLAALGALCVFRRPDVTIDPDAPGGVIVHSVKDKEPLPLTLHHLPLPITFSFFSDAQGELTVIDPVGKEEASCVGTFTVTINPQGELCGVQKAHGIGIDVSEAMQCIRLAESTVKQLTDGLRKALEAHDVARVASRVRRRHSSFVAAGAGAATAAAAVLPDVDVADGGQGDGGVNAMEEEEGMDAEEEQEEEEVGREKKSSPTSTQQQQKEKSKKKKRQRSQQGRGSGGNDDDNTYAEIADIIANAAGAAGGGLEGALKKK